MKRGCAMKMVVGGLLVAAIGLTLPTRLCAQGNGAAHAPDWAKRTPGQLAISAQALEKPDMWFALLPPPTDTEPGNAAVKYEVAAAQAPQLSADETQLLDAARNAQLGALDADDARLKAILRKYENSLQFLHDGSRLESADWHLDIREAAIAAQMPWLVQMRALAGALCVEIRLDIKRHDWAAAQEKLQTGYVLARHIGGGQTLIESLVGLSITGIVNSCVEDWVSQPGAPNLYWPLSNLPSPFNDLHRSMTFEQNLPYFAAPALLRMKQGHYSAQLWMELIDQLRTITELRGSRQERPEWQQEMLGTLAGVAMYPQARRFLMDRGMTPAEVEKMPVAEALGRYFVRSYQEEVDDEFKWMGLPPAQSLPGLAQWETQFRQRAQSNQVNPLARVLLPSLQRAVQTSVRMDRQIAALRAIEALRASAAEKGQWPDSLDALGLPVPADPLGKSFEYSKNGDSAVLTLPADNPRDAVRYELLLQK